MCINLDKKVNFCLAGPAKIAHYKLNIYDGSFFCLALAEHAQPADSKNYRNGALYSNKLFARQVKKFLPPQHEGKV